MEPQITSAQNDRLKLVRRLAERRGRHKEGLFSAEGEDLLEAGLRAGWEPAAVLVAAGSGLSGPGYLEVEPELLDSASALGSGSRVVSVWPLPADGGRPTAPCVYLHGVADPGNVGTIVRTAAALAGATVALGPGCADPWSPKALRASMGAAFAHPPVGAGLAATPAPRLCLVAHGGEDVDLAIAEHRPRTLCVGAEREGLDRATVEGCAAAATIPVLPGAESLNVAAAAAIALHRISSLAGAQHG